MINCNTFVVQNKDTVLNQLNIKGVELLINDDGTLKTKDKDGKETIIGGDSNGNAYGKIKHLEVGINNTTQTHTGNETKIYFDNDFSVEEDDDFSLGDDSNSIKILSAGHYFISFNITLDMYSGTKSTVGGYIKSNNDIVEKSISYNYFQGRSQGFGSINNSFIYDAVENEEISMYVNRKEGSGKFYTVPTSTNFNIFRID